jgi:hypothetical protein
MRAMSSSSRMTQEQSRKGIIAEWHRWAPQQGFRSKPDGRDGMLFYTHLQHKRRDLLTFKSGAGDQWQTIHGCRAR